MEKRITWEGRGGGVNVSVSYCGGRRFNSSAGLLLNAFRCLTSFRPHLQALIRGRSIGHYEIFLLSLDQAKRPFSWDDFS